MANGARYTQRVGARADLAEMIKRDHLTIAIEEGLTEGDLDTLIMHGRAARTADREQKEELQDGTDERSGRSLKAEEIFEREERLRNRLLATAAEVSKTDPRLGKWLSGISFARYRLRELSDTSAPSTEGATPAEAAEIKKVERVEREDIPTRLEALSNFCTALLQPGREVIVERFAARGFTREMIESLGDDAEALAKQGKNRVRAAAATEREAAAARAQLECWMLVRRMVRATAARVPTLMAKYAEC